MAGVSEVADGPVTARANIERVLKELGLAGYLDIYRADEDRVFARVLDPPAFRAVLRGWEKDPGDCSRLHPGAFASYREPGAVMPALQVCLHTGGIAEIDLDLASPMGGDLASALVHLGEFLWHGMTGRKSDQVRMKEWLDRRFGA